MNLAEIISCSVEFPHAMKADKAGATRGRLLTLDAPISIKSPPHAGHAFMALRFDILVKACPRPADIPAACETEFGLRSASAFPDGLWEREALC